MQASVVIPNYNGMQYIEECLKSLQLQESMKEIIVVDNASTDGSVQLIKDKFPQVKLIEMETNTGFSAAVNEGLYAAKSRYVILLNNDTTVEPGFVDALVKRIENKKKCFSVSAMLVSMHNPELIDDAGDYYNALGWAFTVGKGKLRYDYEKPRKIFASCAGAAIYDKEILDKIGYFDENHFAYLEDIDIGMRAKLYGYYNVYEPLAVCNHAGSASSGSRYNAFKTGLAAKNSVYIIYKNMPIAMILLNLPFLLAGFTIKTVFFVKKGYVKEYLSGLIKGIKLSCSKDGKQHKVPFSGKRWKHYVKVQMELWENLIRFFINS